MSYYDSYYYATVPLQQPPHHSPKPFKARIQYLDTISQHFNIHRDYLYNYLGYHLPTIVFNLALDNHDWIEMQKMVYEYGADINAPVRYGSAPIWHEVLNGNFEAVQQLILLGARLDLVNHETRQSLLDLAFVKNFGRTKYLLMAYNVKYYKVLFPGPHITNTKPIIPSEVSDEEK